MFEIRGASLHTRTHISLLNWPIERSALCIRFFFCFKAKRLQHHHRPQDVMHPTTNWDNANAGQPSPQKCVKKLVQPAHVSECRCKYVVYVWTFFRILLFFHILKLTMSAAPSAVWSSGGLLRGYYDLWDMIGLLHCRWADAIKIGCTVPIRLIVKMT